MTEQRKTVLLDLVAKWRARAEACRKFARIATAQVEDVTWRREVYAWDKAADELWAELNESSPDESTPGAAGGP